MDFTDPAFIGSAVVIVLVILFLANAIRIVPEYQRLVVFRLGRLLGVKGPGLILLIPIVDKGVKVDLREFFLEIPRQDSITKDNAPIAVDFITFYKVVDPSMSVVQVGNFAGAAQALASTTLRAVIGDIPLDDVLAKRDEINQILRAKLDEVTERWGVKVTNVEIREIIPPPERAGGDDAADVGRALPPGDRPRSGRHEVRRDHRRGGQQGVGDLERRGKQGVGDPHGRGRAASGDPAGRRFRAGPRNHQPASVDRRPEDDDAAVSGRAQADRRLGVIQDRRADGARGPRGRDRRARRPGDG